MTMRMQHCAGEPEAGTADASRRHPRSGGFTLLEVVMSLAFASVAILGILHSMLSSSLVDEETREQHVALRAAEGKIEEILAFDHGGDIDNLVTTYTAPERATFDVGSLAPPVDAQGAVIPAGAITLDTTDPDLLRVTVAVRWTARRGPRSLAVATALSETQP